MTRNHDGDRQGHPAVRRPEVRLHAAQRYRRAVRLLSDRNGRADPEPGVAVGAQGSDHPHGHAQGRAQGADPGERGLHQHAAAADAATRSRRCRASAIRRAAIRCRSGRLAEDRAAFSATHRHADGPARGVRRRQSQQRRDLCGRPARPGDRRVRHRAASVGRDIDRAVSERRRWTRCARWPSKPTAARSSIATIWRRA